MLRQAVHLRLAGRRQGRFVPPKRDHPRRAEVVAATDRTNVVVQTGLPSHRLTLSRPFPIRRNSGRSIGLLEYGSTGLWKASRTAIARSRFSGAAAAPAGILDSPPVAPVATGLRFIARRITKKPIIRVTLSAKEMSHSGRLRAPRDCRRRRRGRRRDASSRHVPSNQTPAPHLVRYAACLTLPRCDNGRKAARRSSVTRGLSPACRDNTPGITPARCSAMNLVVDQIFSVATNGASLCCGVPSLITIGTTWAFWKR